MQQSINQATNQPTQQSINRPSGSKQASLFVCHCPASHYQPNSKPLNQAAMANLEYGLLKMNKGEISLLAGHTKQTVKANKTTKQSKQTKQQNKQCRIHGHHQLQAHKARTGTPDP